MAQMIFFMFKFDGFWINVKNESRRRYEGGKQKTVKIDKDVFSFDVIIEKTEWICPWLQGYNYELHYHIFGSSPKEYKLLANDQDITEMLSNASERGRIEIIIIKQNSMEDERSLDVTDIANSCDMLECSQSNIGTTTNICNDLDTYNINHVNGGVVDVRDLSIGTRFVDAMAFKHFIRSKAIIENFGLKIKASNRTRVVAVCLHRGYPWRIRAAVCVDGQTFEVRKFEPLHHCPGVNKTGNKQATCSWVAHEIEDMIKKQPNIAPKQIKNNLEMTYGLSLPYMKLWRSREQAREHVFGAVDENFKWVPTLHSELLIRNPGSTITYTYDSDDHSFKRFFLSFKVCVDGFIGGCRHLIRLDACHLKSKYLGMLLSANSLDGNNGLFTIAIAIVESESKSTWEWFLENLIEAFGCTVSPLAFISDMEKGLEQAVKKVFPTAEHRVCIRHLWKNLKKYYHYPDNHKIHNIVWAAANTFTRYEFDARLNELLLISPQLHSYLMKLPYEWSRCNFSHEIKNHYNTNNMAESFNSWIGEARGKPMVDLVDMIRGMMMEQRAERKVMALKWQGELVPFIDNYIREITTRKEQFIVRQSTIYKAEVEGSHVRHEVNIQEKTCTCMYWQITGLPCIHVVAFFGTKEHPMWHRYVDDHYHVCRYHIAYEGAISTLPGKEQWCVSSSEVEIGAPNTMRPRGRPRKSRLKSFMENTSKKINKLHKCSQCKLWGHHRSTCKNPLNEGRSVDGHNSETTLRSKLPIRREALESDDFITNMVDNPSDPSW